MDWSTLNPTERRIALELLLRGPQHRGALADVIGLSPTSLTRLTKPLLADGFIHPVTGDRTITKLGRPTQLLDVRSDEHRFLGVKLTGNAAYAVLTDLRAHELARAETTLEATDADSVVERVEALVEPLIRAEGTPTAIGVGVSGRVIEHRIVEFSEFLDWHEVELAERLHARLASPIVVQNDVAALTQVEDWFGFGRSAASFALITIGQGLGYGLVIDGKNITDENTGVTQIGHHRLDDAGPLCPLGHRGCATAMLTIPGMTSTVSAARGAQVGFDELLDRAAEREPLAREVVDASSRALGRLIATVANITMVADVLVTGDGIRLLDQEWDAVQAALVVNRELRSGPVRVTPYHSTFFDWARGAATSAILAYVTRTGPFAARRHSGPRARTEPVPG